MKKFRVYHIFFAIFFCVFVFSSCGGSGSSQQSSSESSKDAGSGTNAGSGSETAKADSTEKSGSSKGSSSQKGSDKETSASSSAKTDGEKENGEEQAAGTRDSTPVVLVPEAPGTSVLGDDLFSMDVSNTSKGYLCVRYNGSAAKAKVFVITPDDVKYTYDLPPSADWVVLPLTGGSGSYDLEAWEHVVDDKYSNLRKDTIEVSLEDENLPFLYPNQYTWFTEKDDAVAKAAELAKGASTDLDVVSSVYGFTIKNVAYDQEKEDNVKSGYLPDVDETLASGKGICFDYAALMTAMLRSQRIPTRLEIGYSGEAYHAWISVWIEDVGWIDDVIYFDGENWSLMDPTLAAGNNASSVKDYIGDGSHYTVKYSR